MINSTAAYLRRLAAQDPEVEQDVEVVNIENICESSVGVTSCGTMVYDLSDGTTIRVDYQRYAR